MLATNMGTAPASTIVDGVAVKTGLNYGLAGIVTNGFFLIIVFFIDKKLIHIGTILTTFCLGYFMDFGALLISPLNIGAMDFAYKAIFVLLGAVVTAIGLGLYISVDYGMGAIDGLSIGIHRKLNCSYSRCRWVIDAILTVSGIALGASWGLGTLVSIIVTGPIIEFTISFLKRKQKNTVENIL